MSLLTLYLSTYGLQKFKFLPINSHYLPISFINHTLLFSLHKTPLKHHQKTQINNHFFSRKFRFFYVNPKSLLKVSQKGFWRRQSCRGEKIKDGLWRRSWFRPCKATWTRIQTRTEKRPFVNTHFIISWKK